MTKQPKMVPKTKKGKRQNAVTGKMEEIIVPVLEDLSDRIHRVQVRVGEESITRNLCAGCLDKYMPELKKIRDLLEGINS